MALLPDSASLYREFMGLIINTAVKLRRRHRLQSLEWEECLALANLGFVRALKNHDPRKGELGPRIVRKIGDEFIEKVRELRRHGGVVPVSLADVVDPRSLRGGVVPAAIENHPDTNHLIRLALGCPDHVYEAAVYGTTGRKHLKASHVLEGFRRALAERLRLEGWTPLRLELAYKQVREAIA